MSFLISFNLLTWIKEIMLLGMLASISVSSPYDEDHLIVRIICLSQGNGDKQDSLPAPVRSSNNDVVVLHDPLKQVQLLSGPEQYTLY